MVVKMMMTILTMPLSATRFQHSDDNDAVFMSSAAVSPAREDLSHLLRLTVLCLPVLHHHRLGLGLICMGTVSWFSQIARKQHRVHQRDMVPSPCQSYYRHNHWRFETGEIVSQTSTLKRALNHPRLRAREDLRARALRRRRRRATMRTQIQIQIQIQIEQLSST